MVGLVDTVPRDHRTIVSKARLTADGTVSDDFLHLLNWGDGSEVALAAIVDDGGRRVQGSAMRWAWEAGTT